jgi:hypothetical protein
LELRCGVLSLVKLLYQFFYRKSCDEEKRRQDKDHSLKNITEEASADLRQNCRALYAAKYRLLLWRTREIAELNSFLEAGALSVKEWDEALCFIEERYQRALVSIVMSHKKCKEC